VCREAQECVILCRFQDPCDCGVARISDEGVFCAPCTSACGDAVCEGGEGPELCPQDCSPDCVPDQDRCNGEHLQSCNLQGRWETVLCRSDQRCAFGGEAPRVGAACQTRLSPTGGTPLDGGALPLSPTGDSGAIRFLARDLGAPGRVEGLVQGGALAVGAEARVFTVALETGELRLTSTFTAANAGPAVVGEGVLAWGGRWPRLAFYAQDRDLTAQAVVHDRAFARPGAVAVTRDGQRLGATFEIGYDEAAALPTVAIWDTASGQISALLRFWDEAVTRDTRATALAFSADGALLVEGRGPLAIFWNLAERRVIWIVQTGLPVVTGITFSDAPRGPSARKLLFRGADAAALWSLPAGGQGEPAQVWRRDGRADHAAFSPNGEVLALSVGDQTLLLEVETQAILQRLPDAGPLSFHPEGDRLLIDDRLYQDRL
jgi:hypothetical protein